MKLFPTDLVSEKATADRSISYEAVSKRIPDSWSAVFSTTNCSELRRPSTMMPVVVRSALYARPNTHVTSASTTAMTNPRLCVLRQSKILRQDVTACRHPVRVNAPTHLYRCRSLTRGSRRDCVIHLFEGHTATRFLNDTLQFHNRPDCSDHGVIAIFHGDEINLVPRTQS